MRSESPLTELLRLEQMCRAGAHQSLVQSAPEYAGCAQLQMRSHSVEDHRRRSSSSELLSPVNFFHKVRAPSVAESIGWRGRRDSDGDSTLQNASHNIQDAVCIQWDRFVLAGGSIDMFASRSHRQRFIVPAALRCKLHLTCCRCRSMLLPPSS